MQLCVESPDRGRRGVARAPRVGIMGLNPAGARSWQTALQLGWCGDIGCRRSAGRPPGTSGYRWRRRGRSELVHGAPRRLLGLRGRRYGSWTGRCSRFARPRSAIAGLVVACAVCVAYPGTASAFYISPPCYDDSGQGVACWTDSITRSGRTYVYTWSTNRWTRYVSLATWGYPPGSSPDTSDWTSPGPNAINGPWGEILSHPPQLSSCDGFTCTAPDAADPSTWLPPGTYSITFRLDSFRPR